MITKKTAAWAVTGALGITCSLYVSKDYAVPRRQPRQ